VQYFCTASQYECQLASGGTWYRIMGTLRIVLIPSRRGGREQMHR